MSQGRTFSDGAPVLNGDADESVIQFDRLWFENYHSKSFEKISQDLSINQHALADWFEASMRHGGDGQAYAQFVVENLRHVSEAQFVDALLRAARDAIDPYEIRSQVVVVLGETNPRTIWATLMVWKQIRHVVTSVVLYEDFQTLENITPEETTALFVSDVYLDEEESSIDVTSFVGEGGDFRYVCGAYIDIYEDKGKFGKALRIKSVSTLLKDSLILKNDREARRILERFGEYSPQLKEGFTFFDHLVPRNLRDLLFLSPEINPQTGVVRTQSLIKTFKSPQKYKFSTENGRFKFKYSPQSVGDIDGIFSIKFNGKPIYHLNVVFGKPDPLKEIPPQDEPSGTEQSGGESDEDDDDDDSEN